MKFKIISISIIAVLSLTLIFFTVSIIVRNKNSKLLDKLKIENIDQRIENYENDINQIDTIIPVLEHSVIVTKADSIIRANGF